MKIYRVEDDKGFGCYTAHDPELENLYARHNADQKTHPVPSYDKGIERYPKENELCGFIDEKQARNWFSLAELRELHENGFDLKEVEVLNITAYGQYQVLAVKQTSVGRC